MGRKWERFKKRVFPGLYIVSPSDLVENLRVDFTLQILVKCDFLSSTVMVILLYKSTLFFVLRNGPAHVVLVSAIGVPF